MIGDLLQAGAYGAVFLVGAGMGAIAMFLAVVACLYLDDKFLRRP